MRVRLSVLAVVVVALLAVLAGQGTAALAAVRSAQGAAARPVIASFSPSAGPVGGGTAITVRGARFASGATVTVGGRKARAVKVKSATLLTAVVPAHTAGAATVAVTDKAGTAKSGVRFAYLDKPSFAGLSAHSGPVTGGSVATITGRHLSHVTAVLFGTLKAKVLAGGTSSKVRVQVPASWAGTVDVRVHTMGGTTARLGRDRYTYKNPKAQLSGRLTAASGTVVAASADVTAVAGGPAAAGQVTPWTVTLTPAATLPSAGQQFLLRPGGAVYPGGLAGTVTAADTATDTVTVSPAGLDAAVGFATATFTGPLGNASAAGPSAATGTRPAGTSLTSEIDFGAIDASELACDGLDGKSVKVTGSFSLTLTNVEAHLQLDAGSLVSKPFVEAWVSYEPTIEFSLKAEDEASCSIPPSFQNEHEKVFFLGDTGATIAIAPDASFSVSVSGKVTFSQHSHRLLGFVSNPDGSISKLDGQSSDPAQVTASGELKAEAYGGVQIQLGELNVIGVGMSLGGGVAGTAESAWSPLVCLSAYPFLRGTLYAYLNLWVREWKLQAFQVELDLAGISSCTPAATMYAWGQDGDSSLGAASGLQAVPVPGPDVSFAFGNGFGYALEQDGTVNSFNMATFKRTPVGGLAGITALAVNGDDTVYALRDDGRVLAWNPPQTVNNKPENGNAAGELGDGTTKDSGTPVLVHGVTTATAVSAGVDTGYALLGNGTVMTWGGNEVNQLGDGTDRAYVTTPQLVPGLSGVRQVAGAWQGAFAVLGNGTVMKWGCDAAAASVQANGTHIVQPTPVPLAGVKNAVAVAGGYDAGYALISDGTVWSWGDSWSGVLGRGSNKGGWYKPAPVPGIGHITAIASSQSDAGFALASDGHLYTWGSLTENTASEHNAPTQIPGLSHVLAVGAGAFAAWAATSSG